MNTPTLHTARLVLEPVSLAHVDGLQRHFANWQIIRRLSVAVPWPYPDDGVKTFLEGDLLPRITAGKAMAWALRAKNEDGSLSEAIGLLEWRRDPASTDHRGFWLAEDWQGSGLMTEAVIAFQDYIFLELGHDRLVVHNAVTNTGSGRIKEKTGGVRLGIVELAHHEGITDTQAWEITAEAWLTLRAD
ncbi:MAG: GNAT family N-acetyltransferase [Proteobacteria bacterium]|nr:GNAT family N-acetyltransferase [Pseudomonadota bacterium]